MIDTLAQVVGFPFAILLITACIAIAIAVVTDAFVERKNCRRPIAKIPPLKFNPGADQSRLAQLQPASDRDRSRLLVKRETAVAVDLTPTDQNELQMVKQVPFTKPSNACPPRQQEES